MNYKYGVYVNGLLMNRFLTALQANKLIVSFAEKGVLAVVRPLCVCGGIS